MKNAGILIATLSFLALLGCAGWSQHGAAPEPSSRPIVAPARTSQASGAAAGAVGASAVAGTASGWDGATCHESPASTDGIQRDGGAIAARMATPLVAGRETKVLWKPQNRYRAATLRITAERLDGPAAPAEWSVNHVFLDRAETIDGGYASAITVPTSGCWRLTAHLGNTLASVTVDVTG